MNSDDWHGIGTAEKQIWLLIISFHNLTKCLNVPSLILVSLNQTYRYIKFSTWLFSYNMQVLRMCWYLDSLLPGWTSIQQLNTCILWRTKASKDDKKGKNFLQDEVENVMLMLNFLSRMAYNFIYLFFLTLFQLLKLLSSGGQAEPYFGLNPMSSLPCLRLKYRSTQRTTSPVNQSSSLHLYSNSY